MYRMLKPEEVCYENVSNVLHKEHETRNTRVSEYLRKYGQGRIDTLPTDSRPEVHDERSVDEMLDNPNKLADSLGTEQLDALVEFQRKSEDYEKAIADIKLTQKQKKAFDDAIATLKDANASYEEKSAAMALLDEYERDGKITRARV